MPQQNKFNEQERLHLLTQYEEEARSQGFHSIAGVDEAGRGPLAGPVVAAACIIPRDLFFSGVNDSKKLTPRQRETLFHEITSCNRVIYASGVISHTEIDLINIYQATIAAMLEAVNGLSVIPDYLLVDGMKLPHPIIPCQKIIRGDALSQSIAAASIIAKVTRDRLMEEYDGEWPQYGFKQHKGYPTKAHCEAIAHHGPCPIHRLTFAPLRK